MRAMWLYRSVFLNLYYPHNAFKHWQNMARNVLLLTYITFSIFDIITTATTTNNNDDDNNMTILEIVIIIIII